MHLLGCFLVILEGGRHGAQLGEDQEAADVGLWEVSASGPAS